MAITSDQKREIANAFGVSPSHYFNKGNLIDSSLYKFGNMGHLSFKFSDRRGTKPGIGFYVKDGNRAVRTQEFGQIELPVGFSLDDGQPHVGDGDGGNGWISFCKQGIDNQEQAYADIVNPGNGAEAWRSLLTMLRDRISEIIHSPATCFAEEKGWIQNHAASESPLAYEQANENLLGQQHQVKDADIASWYPRNCLIFGAPGTGKSHRLNEEAKKSFTEANSERVTFYATYSYAQFVGTYKPVMKGEGVNEKIAYEFVPGPFLRTLVKALNRPEENFLLIIEEINRANAAAVFGDVFQLLDRGVDGVSEYSIAASEDVKKYLEKALTEAGKQVLTTAAGAADMLKIPANLYLWATMNSADQGVFPLDTAFKRRWSFEYVGINESADACDTWKVPVKDKFYNWNAVRSLINALLSLNGVNEDKLMGPFFVKAESADVVSAKQFESKVLMYLWEDAARMCRGKLFGSIRTYFKLIEQWREKGPQMFKELMKEGGAAKRDEDVNEAWGNLFPSMAASNA